MGEHTPMHLHAAAAAAQVGATWDAGSPCFRCSPMACQKTEGLASCRTLHTIFLCPALQPGFSCSHIDVKPRRAGTVGWGRGAPMEQPCGPRSKLPSVTRTASDVHRLILQSSLYQGFISAAALPVTCGSAVIDCKPMHLPRASSPGGPTHHMASHGGDFGCQKASP